MTRRSDESYPKEARIRSRSEYLSVQGRGTRAHTRAFLGLFLDRGDRDRPRIGITTTRRLGSAVTRNRIRRMVREAFRRGLVGLPDGVDLVVVAKKSVADLGSTEILAELGRLGGRVRAAHGRAAEISR